jgi:DNA-binding LacI/PurR family transcriptional regulator
MGQKAAEILLARLSNEPPQQFQQIILPAEIVVRKSSGQPIGQYAT